MSSRKKYLNLFYLISFIGFLLVVYILSHLFFCYLIFKKNNYNTNDLVPASVKEMIVSKLSVSSSPEVMVASSTLISTSSTTMSTSPSKFLDNTSTPVKISAPIDNLTFCSFFDSFSSNILINPNKTSLYRDNTVTAVTFPPDYSWSQADSAAIEANKNKLDSFILNDFAETAANIYDKRCLENNCLEQNNNKLTFNGRVISYPQKVNNNNLKAISIGVVGKNWLLGFTLKEGNTYSGFVYSFDGKKFTPVLPDKNINSPYFGRFGFGGEESDFLVVYGAYKGVAYRVQEEAVTDVSKFFDYRVMDKGFKPEIIKASNTDYTNWYVFSLSTDKPHFLKLWEDKNNNISGEISYLDSSNNNDSIFLMPLKNNSSEVSLFAKIGNSHTYSWKTFTDRGFHNQSDGLLYFDKVNMAVSIKKLANAKLGSDDFPFPEGQLLFSNNETNWQIIPQGYYLNQDFITDKISGFFLKVIISKQNNKFYSPFLKEVLFDFYY